MVEPFNSDDFSLLQNDLVVETSLVGVVNNGLSHLHHVKNKSHFAVCLIHGLGGNLSESARELFAKEASYIFCFCCCWSCFWYSWSPWLWMLLVWSISVFQLQEDGTACVIIITNRQKILGTAIEFSSQLFSSFLLSFFLSFIFFFVLFLFL